MIYKIVGKLDDWQHRLYMRTSWRFLDDGMTFICDWWERLNVEPDE